jgi:hypothetical protein
MEPPDELGAPETPSPPPPPPPPGPVARSGNPWDRRTRLGWGRALLGTIKEFVADPSRAYAQTLERGDYAGPLIFAVLIGWVSTLFGLVWQLVFGSTMLAWLPGELYDEVQAMMVHTWIGFAAQLLILPFYVVFSLFVIAAIMHLSMLLVGGLSKSRSGFEGTLRAGAFSSVANLANLIPLFGFLIAGIWSIVLGVIGLASLHRTTPLRAFFAVLLPLVLCCVCMALGIAVAASLGSSLLTSLTGQG